MSIDTHPFINQAILEARSNYGVEVSVEAKQKSLLKFGHNAAVTNAEPGSTIMTLPAGVNNETYVSTNIIDTISSDNTGDTEDIRIEGHAVAGGNLTFLVQTVTLSGQTKVSLPTPLVRVTRAYNAGTSDLAGVVYVYEDGTITAGVPDVASTVHLMIDAGKNQSNKAATSLDSTTFWFVTHFYADVLEKTASFVEVRLEIREWGKVFREVATISSAGGHSRLGFDPYLVVPPNTDIRLVGVGSAAGLDVSGGIQGFLALVVT